MVQAYIHYCKVYKLPFSDRFSPTTILPHPLEHTPHPSLLLLDDMTVLQDLDSVSQEKDQKRKRYHIHGGCLAKNRNGLRMLGNRTSLQHICLIFFLSAGQPPGKLLPSYSEDPFRTAL